VTILARTTMQELTAGVGVAIGGHGEQFSISKLLEMSADAHVIPVVCNEAGGILAYGREKRLAARGQRLALVARDGGCSFPGCDRPPAWCQAHHVVEWIDDGPTDLDNLTLVRLSHEWRAFDDLILGWSRIGRGRECASCRSRSVAAVAAFGAGVAA
jgi:hypothetical protein